MTPLFSTAYFPPVGYVATMLQHTERRERAELCIEAKETFPKQTYRNRMDIMTAGGVRTLTVPVIRGNHSRTDEVGIDYKERWNVMHLRTLTAAYAASPYFQYYSDELEALLMPRYERLLDLNMAVTEWLLKKLKTKCTLKLTEDWIRPTGDPYDYRDTFTPKRPYPTDGMKPYYQVFSDRIPFTPNLSVLDLLMNTGPEAIEYLQ